MSTLQAQEVEAARAESSQLNSGAAGGSLNHDITAAPSQQIRRDLEAATLLTELVNNIKANNDANKNAADRLLKIRSQIDTVLKPITFWDQMVTHKVLIMTIFLTVLGMVGSILGLVTGSLAEKDRAGYVLAGAVLSLVGNTISSATGIFVPPPTLAGKKTTESKELGVAVT